MNYPHPVFMFLILAVACVALRQGSIRFAAVRLGRKALFPWRTHVLLGKIALAGMLLGLVTGLSTTWLVWTAPFTTGAHGKVAVVIGALAVSGLATGMKLDKLKKPGTRLGLIHAVGNTLAVLLAFFQLYSGFDLLRAVAW